MPHPARYDPLDPATLAHPYPVLAALRAAEPVSWHESMHCWLLTGYADCVAVLRDHELFARDRRRLGAEVPQPSLSVQSLDPPDQAEVRSLFMNALNAQDLPGIQGRAEQRLAHWLDGLDARPRFDVMAEIAVPLSLAVISDLLGVEEPDHSSFAQVSDAVMRSMDGGLDPSLVEPGRLARQQLSELVASWFRTSGRPGLLTHVRDHAAGQRDTGLDLFIRNTARVMFQGGYSTMVAAIGNVVHTLLTRPDVLERMRDPRLLQTGVDELVRFDGPVQGTSRIATRACELGGRKIDAGQTVTVLLAAANHDPVQFTEPGRLLLDRSPNRHLGFGWGTHSCIGTTAAQMALRALVRGLLAHPAPLRAAGAAVRRRTATMRAFDVLPATFGPGGTAGRR
ncbi:cytochrome P450 [Kitasatospora kifunensis]|uniref:Cytochrome P450 n=1 Tax=Kitasatospora kifunensis TaxID=58351 RepID=A0A7W7VT38_KITKI|nr:cytochrome P450 [Kitasatospora kifunensis]MBB4921045.1 cytochrome P450 [Kitasatospora kifunensis]